MAGRSTARFNPAIRRFVVLFFVLVIGLTLIVQLSFVDEQLVDPYTGVLAAISAQCISLVEPDTVARGSILHKGFFAVDVKRGCDGLVATILLCSACLAYPMSWRDRIGGVLIGYSLIFALNLIRIVSLFLIGYRASRSTFDFFHTYVSQFAVIAVTMVFWVYWAGRKPSASSP